VSTETGIARLGGHALFLGSEDIQLGANESLQDTARVLGRFNDVILARVYGHEVIEGLTEHSPVPVINALSDKYHPLQILADLQTLQETFCPPPADGSAPPAADGLSGVKVAWVGDGNNIAHSILAGMPRLGVQVAVATPKGYECDSDVAARAIAVAEAAGAPVPLFTTDPVEAVRGADVIVTDTWVSMGQEEEKARRLKQFSGYQVTEQLGAGAKPGWKFLHCLPRKPEEVSDEVFYGERSLVWDEAENRMWTVMAVALAQLEGGMRG